MTLVAVRERYPFKPDYAVIPGETLAEVLAERGMSQAELARHADLSTKHVNQIISGAASITADTAIRLERVTCNSGTFLDKSRGSVPGG